MELKELIVHQILHVLDTTRQRIFTKKMLFLPKCVKIPNLSKFYGAAVANAGTTSIQILLEM